MGNRHKLAICIMSVFWVSSCIMEVSSSAGPLAGNREQETAEAALLIALPLLLQRRWMALCITLPSLLLPQSRAALIAAWVLLLSKRYWITSLALLGLGILLHLP